MAPFIPFTFSHFNSTASINSLTNPASSKLHNRDEDIDSLFANRGDEVVVTCAMLNFENCADAR